MDPLAFPLCVAVEVPGRLGLHRAVGSVSEAAEVLTEGWPAEGRGADFVEALEACVEALGRNKRITPASVRWSFEKTAKEVDIFVCKRNRRGEKTP